MNPLQPEIEAKGLEIFARMRGEGPRAFSRKNAAGRLMEWSMRNERLKAQLFRFVDVLPTLVSSKEIARHAYEYLGNGNGGLPAPVRWAIRHSPKFPWLAGVVARKSVEQMARTFILARNGSEAVFKLRDMRAWPIAFTADILGETVVSESEAESYQTRYLELIESLAAEARKWPLVEQIDCDERGELPRVSVSVKISALYSQILPADPEGALARLGARLRPLLLRAKELGVFINFDMESTALKDLTLELFKRLLDEPGLKDYAHAGIALQAYLRDTERDLEDLIQWARSRHRAITVRLIKGAYWDYETVLAQQRGWPLPVFGCKTETDLNYEQLARRMIDNERHIRCAFGTHSVRSIAACMVLARKAGVPQRNCEFQMLYGMAEPIKLALIKMGCRVRDYCPIGEVLPGMSYLVRRLLENTSNEGFLRATFSDRTSPQDLLRDPKELSNAPPAIASKGEQNQTTLRTRAWQPYPATAMPFQNEPHTDFTIAAQREKMAHALAKVRSQLGQKYPLVIGEKEVWTDREIVSINPARPNEVVGRIAKGGTAEAETALARARDAFPEWSRTSVEERSQILQRAADLIRQQRFELAALEVYETGKNWLEADADVAEAIDFCNFYAQEMRRIAEYRYVIPGETSVNHYIPRGLGVVIAPWNFPLAILCGMTAAAVVAGNCVIMKPSEQSAVIGARFMDILRKAGLPPGVANFLPGAGSEVGAYLVNHPEIALIAFTGSREVGLKIYEAAGQTRPGQAQLKKVICEMGGKNAAIIDSDADLDEAIPALVSSAFGYQGQKCSALSRLIVLKENYDRVLHRLIEASRSLQVGFPEDPGTSIGPVIDDEAYRRIRGYIESGKGEAELAFQGRVPEGEGYFIAPTIFTNVPRDARIAREEVFGPVLCVMKSDDLSQALDLTNDSPYALTGGFFSRSPANIERARVEMQVGNLYINRTITGALVARHPFGGFKMSGGGTKAGGRDYLQHFLFPRVVTENLMRRGFAPEEAGPANAEALGGE